MKLSPNLAAKARLIQAWRAGVASVVGEPVTRAALAADRESGQLEPITHLLAVGKAAASMCAGATVQFTTDARALVVTKYAHSHNALAAHPAVTVMESGHPIPDENSLRAGAAMEAFVRSVAKSAQLVVLVSGGASALAEILPTGVDLHGLQTLTTRLLGGGYSIEQMNAVRLRLSRIKGGQLLRQFGGRSIRVYAISDVAGDDIRLIGGGMASGQISIPPDWSLELTRDLMRGLPQAEAGALATDLSPMMMNPDAGGARAVDYAVKVIASNRIAREHAARFLRDCGLDIIVNQETLYLDLHAAAQQVAAELLLGPPGAYIWGGEPTVILPPKPGIGGRNQSLALAIAKEIRGQRKISVLAAGTDGTDGPTDSAGGLIDGDTFDVAPRRADQALTGADAGVYLNRLKARFTPGPTGTNVMDLVIALKQK